VRTIGDSEYGHHEPDGTHLTSRGTSRDAASLIRAIVANHDQAPVTAHDYAAQTPGQRYPTAFAHFSTVERLLRTVDGQPMRPGAPKQRATHNP
jgi:hypothetical protein